MTRAEARFVQKSRVGFLATADAHGNPSNVPFCFSFDGSTLYSPIDEKPKSGGPDELKRIRNIRANPSVCIVVHHYEEDWARLGHIILRGRARILMRGRTHRSAVKQLRRKYPQYRAMAIHERPIVAIRVTRSVIWGRID